VSVLAAFSRADATAVRRWTVAAVAMAAADIAAFAILRTAGAPLELAQLAAFPVALGAGAFLLRGAGWPGPASSLAVVAMLAFPLRAGTLSLLAASMPYALAIVPAAAAGALTLLAGLAALARDERVAPRTGMALAAIAYLVVLRLVYAGQLELMPQEAYYWNYAQHLDIGYLDHPPLVAWLIAASGALGSGEFFVRLPAIAASIAMLGFAVVYARELAPAGAGATSAVLACALPYFFVAGFVTTPDAPLMAAWAAALVFLRRALVDGRASAWVPAGVAVGLGMLSKYTMVLVPAAALAFVLLDARARRALATPGPWLAALVALAVFAPVIVWNVRHDFASFAFQGSRRLASAQPQFGLHEFVAFALLLATPPGLLALWRLLRDRTCPAGEGGLPIAGEDAARSRRFALVFALVPLAILAAASLRAETKVHWTGPIWLAVLPALAASVGLGVRREGARWTRAWVPMLHVLMLAYAYGLFYYPVWGVAGVRAHHHYLRMGWSDLRAQVQRLEDDVTRETGRRPAIVGLDKHNTADEMAFYDPRGDGARDTASRHLFFDENALMYEWWFPPSAYAGRDLVVVARSRDDVVDERVAARATRLGPVEVLTVRKGGVPLDTYYARVVYGYRPPERAR